MESFWNIVWIDIVFCLQMFDSWVICIFECKDCHSTEEDFPKVLKHLYVPSFPTVDLFLSFLSQYCNTFHFGTYQNNWKPDTCIQLLNYAHIYCSIQLTFSDGRRIQSLPDGALKRPDSSKYLSSRPPLISVHR